MGYSNVIRYIGGNQTPGRKAFFEQVLARLPEYEICQFPNPMDAFREIEDSEHVITLPILVESKIDPIFLKNVKDAATSFSCSHEAARYTMWRVRLSLQACLAPIFVVSDNPLHPRDTVFYAGAGATDKISINSPKDLDFFEKLIKGRTPKRKV